MSKIHATAVGNLVAGRSNLLNLPTNVSKHDVSVDGKTSAVTLRDTGHMEELDRLQPAVYRDTNCFLLCYSENERVSFNAIESKWCQEITRICPNVPFILVAYKTGNHGGDGAKAVTSAEGQKLKQKIAAAAFFEYSTDADLEALLAEVVRAKSRQRAPAEAVSHSAPEAVDEGASSSGGLCSCFNNCFKKKDSSYSFQ